ncbi:MAG: hypothetical protein ABI383_07565 [Acidobacteriaceae bacterium]
MMRDRHLLLLTISGILLSGCHKREPVTLAPAAMPPSIQPQPSPSLPAAATTPSGTTVRPPADVANSVPEKPKPIHRSHKQKPSPSNPPPVMAAGNQPETAPEPVITTPSGQNNHLRASTEQLLDITDRNLSGLHYTDLSDDDKATVQQIRGYEKDSRDALVAEDFTRAHNLAVKAQLLSSALVHAH